MKPIPFTFAASLLLFVSALPKSAHAETSQAPPPVLVYGGDLTPILSKQAVTYSVEVDQLAAAKDVDGLSRLLRTVILAWKSKRDPEYLAVVLKLLGRWSGADFGEQNRGREGLAIFEGANEVLAFAAASDANIPVDSQAKLYEYEDFRFDAVGLGNGTVEFTKWRAGSLAGRLKLLARMRSYLDGVPKVTGLRPPYFMNVSPRLKKPPTLDHLPYAGMDPSEIQDKEDRQSYVEAITENSKKRDYFIEVGEVETLYASFSRDTLNFVKSAYPKDTGSENELEKVVTQFAPAELKAALLKR